MGYCTLDIIRQNGRVSHSAGGTAANVAANLAYLGWSSALVARCGNDAPARRILRDLRNGNVAIDLVERDHEVETPVILHDVRPPFHRFLFGCPECGRKFPRYRPISTSHLNAKFLEAKHPTPAVFFFDRASASSILLAEEMHGRGALIVFEPSSRGVTERTLRAAQTAHVVKLSHERRKVLDQAVLSARPGQLQIETLGASGLRYRMGSGRWKRLPARPTTVTDSGGAGDWFTAGFLTHLAPLCSIKSTSLVEAALHRAQAVAALSCRVVGARTLARLSRGTLDEVLLSNEEPDLPALSSGSRSRARVGCRLCLGPTTQPA